MTFEELKDKSNPVHSTIKTCKQLGIPVNERALYALADSARLSAKRGGFFINFQYEIPHMLNHEFVLCMVMFYLHGDKVIPSKPYLPSQPIEHHHV